VDRRAFKRGRRRIVRIIAASGATLAVAGAAGAALQGLPPSGAQVNDDPAASIDPQRDAGAVDVQGGTVKPGALQVPWATFEQKTTSGQQIFVRAFKQGAWQTQGFPASLNIDPTKEAEGPSIDFAGPGRTVPWVSWYEPNSHFPGGARNIFASRFNAAANLWLPSGQDRTAGSHVPSLNINTDRDAEDPSVFGGAALAGADPVPWVTWQEKDGPSAGQKDQIFVSRGVKQPAAGTACTGFVPGSGPNVNGFCWQEVGVPRVSTTSLDQSGATDASLNVDTSRDGVEPDGAFTGPNDTVPWVVWYEKGASANGLRGNEMVFAAKAVRDTTLPVTTLGGFRFVAVGNGTAGQVNVLDASAPHGGKCATSQTAEKACSLNNDPTADAEDPRVAAGSLAPGKPTVPWVVWAEDVGGGRHGIFVSRLVGDHFELFNHGQPISNIVNDSTVPDIAFSGHVPYITWHERVGGADRTFTGHFEGGAAAPVFRLDTPLGIPTAGDLAQRSPVSSTCTANPTNADGSTCQAAALGTPFLLRTTAGSPHRLFAHAYAPSRALTLAPRAVTDSSAVVRGLVNPGGAPVAVRFEFGRTAAFGSTTAPIRLPAGVADRVVEARLANLHPSAYYHVRVVVTTDLGVFRGADHVLRTARNHPPVVHVRAPHDASLAGRHPRLRVRFTLSERASVTVALVRHGHVLRSRLLRGARPGAHTIVLGLRGLRAGQATLRVVARDPYGARGRVLRTIRLES
jgi:hypothetical protein